MRKKKNKKNITPYDQKGSVGQHRTLHAPSGIWDLGLQCYCPSWNRACKLVWGGRLPEDICPALSLSGWLPPVWDGLEDSKYGKKKHLGRGKCVSVNSLEQ